MAVEPRSDGIILAGFQGSADAPRLAFFDKFPADNPLRQDAEALTRALRPCVEQAGARGAAAATVLFRSEVNFILTEAPDVDRPEWRDALKWRVRDLLDFPVEEAVVDAFPVGLEVPGEGPQAFVVAARRELVRQRVTAAGEAGLDLRYVDVPDLAQRNLSRLLPEPSYGTCLVVLDELCPLISITKGGELCFSRQIGMDIGEEMDRLAAELGLEPAEARRRRVEQGLVGPDAASADAAGGGEEGALALEEAASEAGGGASGALAGFADRLALEIQRSLDYYDSRFRQAAIGKIFLGGEGARIRGLEDYLEEALGLEFEFFHPLDHLEVDPGIAQRREEVAYPIHEGILAVGAGLRMLDPEVG